MKKVCKHLGWIIPLIVFLVCFGLMMTSYAKYGQYNLDSDMSSDMVLADLLNKEGKIITTNYFYSNELNIISPILVFQLALKLFKSWHVARTFSIGLMVLIMVASLIYLTRPARVSLGTCLLASAALIMPVSRYQAFTLIYGSFYMNWVTLTFLEVGFVLRMKKKRLLEPILLVILGVLGSLSGIRMLMVCAGPLLAATLILFYLEARHTQSLKEAISVPSFPALVGSLLCLVSNGIGYLISTNVLANIYHFKEFDDTVLVKLQHGMLPDQLMALKEFFGYRADAMLMASEGIYSMFAFVLPVLGMISLVLLLRMKLNPIERLLAIFADVALIIGMIINVVVLYDDNTFLNGYSVAYYMPAALLCVFAIFWMFDRFECHLPVLRFIPMLVGVCFFVLGFTVYEDKEVNFYDDEMTTISNLLLKEGCHEGYATYWHANVLTEISDGQIEVFMVDDWESGKVGEWLQQVDHLTREPQGRIFAIFTENDYNNGIPGCDDEHLVYSSDRSYVCIYEDINEFHQLRGDTVSY